MEEKYKVYTLTSPEGKSYVGMTMRDLEKRWRKGSGYLYNKELYSDIQKFGWENFEKNIVASNLSRSEAEMAEQRWIEKLETQNPEKGYNKEKGGLHPDRLNENTKKKMSISHIGLPRSEEYRKNISKSKRGSQNGMYGKTGKENPTSKPVIAIKDGEEFGRYDSLTEANVALGLPDGAFKNISSCCHGERKIAYGYSWRFAE